MGFLGNTVFRLVSTPQLMESTPTVKENTSHASPEDDQVRKKDTALTLCYRTEA